MKGYKGFDEGLMCRGKQYAENTIFEEDNAKICEAGMHFCENPLDVLDYYDLTTSEFAEVEALDEVKTDDWKKYCTKKLKIGEKLSFPGFVEASVDFLSRNAKTDAASGYYAQLAESGDGAQLAESGDGAQLAESGDGAQLAASGDFAQLASSGDGAQLAASGDFAQLASSGDDAQLASSGYRAKLAASGDDAQLAASGNYAHLAASGYGVRLATSGNRAQLAASGNRARLVASSDYARLVASGDRAVIANIGYKGSAKGALGTWITLAEYDGDTCVCVKSAQIDGEILKEDTWYALQDGEFKEVKA